MSDTQERKEQAIQDLFQSADTSAALRKLTGVEIAGLIEEHLMASLDMTEPAYSLLDEVVMRLDPERRVT